MPRRAPCLETSEQSTHAATRIQAAIRGYAARKKYKITPINLNAIQPGFVYCTGNEPCFSVPDNLKSHEPFALIATSCLYVLYVAHLFCATQTNFIPKIYIVDINPRVKDFWLIIQDIFRCSANLTEFSDNIKKDEEQFTLPNTDKPIVDLKTPFKTHAENMTKVIQYICGTIEFERVKKIVSNLVVFTHDWTDPALFQTIKAICTLIGLKSMYAYASNIISCIDLGCFDQDPKIAQMFRNIAMLKPIATVHANIDPTTNIPTRVNCYAGAGDLAQLQCDIGSMERSKTQITCAYNCALRACQSREYSHAYWLALSGYHLFIRVFWRPNLQCVFQNADLVMSPTAGLAVPKNSSMSPESRPASANQDDVPETIKRCSGKIAHVKQCCCSPTQEQMPAFALLCHILSASAHQLSQSRMEAEVCQLTLDTVLRYLMEAQALLAKTDQPILLQDTTNRILQVQETVKNHRQIQPQSTDSTAQTSVSMSKTL